LLAGLLDARSRGLDDAETIAAAVAVGTAAALRESPGSVCLDDVASVRRGVSIARVAG